MKLLFKGSIFLIILIVCNRCKKEQEQGFTFEEKMTIGVDGGVFKVTDAQSPINGLIILFPEAALSEELLVTVRAMQDPAELNINQMEQLSKVIDISTSGDNNFNKPVEITVPLSINLEDKFFVTYALYYNKSAKDWEGLEVVATDSTNNTITFRTDHFSRFLIGGIDFGTQSMLDNEVLDSINYAAFSIDYEWCEQLNIVKGILRSQASKTISEIQKMTYPIKTCENQSLCGTSNVFFWLYNRIEEDIAKIELDEGVKMLRTISLSKGTKLDNKLLSILRSPCLLCAIKNDNIRPIIVNFITEYWYIRVNAFKS